METKNGLNAYQISFLAYFFILLSLLISAFFVGSIKGKSNLIFLYSASFFTIVVFLFILSLLKQNSFHFSLILLLSFLTHTIFVFRYEDKVHDFQQIFSDQAKRFNVAGRVREIYGLKDGRYRFLLEMRQIEGEKLHVLPNGYFAQVYLSGGDPKNLSVGQIIELQKTGASFTKEKNDPKSSSYDQYLRNEGLVASFFPRTSQLRVKEELTRVDFPLAFFQFKDDLKRKLQNLLPNEVYGFSKALVLGDRTQVDPTLTRFFQNAGIAHFIAISGVHIAILSLFLFTFLRPIFKARLSRKIIVFIFLPFYLFILYFSAPILRTFLMLVLAMFLSRIGRPLNKHPHLFFALFFSSFILHLLFIPNDIFSASFQLSFAATLGLFVALHFTDRFKGLPKPIFWTIRFLILSFAAQLFTEPFVLHYFNLFSPMSIAYNALFHPFIFIYLLLTFSLLFLPHFLGIHLAKVLVWFYELMTGFFSFLAPYTRFYDVEFDAINALLLVSSISLFTFLAFKSKSDSN